MPAYFISNLRNRVRASGRMGVDIEVKEAVLVAPIRYRLKLDEVLNLSSLNTEYEPQVSWQVYGIDDLSSPTIAYHHMTQVLKAKDSVEKHSLVDTDGKVEEGQVIMLDTENGFIQSEPAARVVSRDANVVEIQVPMNIELFKVKIKQDGEVVEQLYEVEK